MRIKPPTAYHCQCQYFRQRHGKPDAFRPQQQREQEVYGYKQPYPPQEHKRHSRPHPLNALAIAHKGDIQDEERDADGVIGKPVLRDAGGCAVRNQEQGHQQVRQEQEQGITTMPHSKAVASSNRRAFTTYSQREMP